MENQVAEPEVNSEQLRQEILTEKKGSVPEGKKPWELRMEQDHPELPVKKEEEKEAIEEPKETPKEEPNSEEQPAETESAPAKQPDEEAQPVEAKKDTAKEEDAYIAEYAKNSGLSVEDAKEEVVKLRAISKKYNDDPVKIAKAYREVQSAYDKQKVQASSNVNPAVAAIAANPRNYAMGEVKNNPEWVQAYREQNPARSRDMDDEQVVEALVEIRSSVLKNQIGEFEIRLKREAANKREELLRGIPEIDRRYLPEIKPVLEGLPDHQVVGDSFRFEDLVSWAKGKSVDRLIKETEERIHKQYEAKNRNIVGEISKTPQTTKVKQAQEQSKGAGMSKWQKEQALQMFASSPISDDEKFEAYLDVTKKKK